MSLPEGGLAPAAEAHEDLVRALVAVVCAGSAGVHAALAVDHLHESVFLASAFVLETALPAVSARRAGDRRASALPSAAVLMATALAYLVSRTSGFPGLLPTPEPLDGLGVLTTSSELVGAVACLLLTFRKEQR